MTSLGRFSLLLAASLLLARCSATTADLEPIAWQKCPGAPRVAPSWAWAAPATSTSGVTSPSPLSRMRRLQAVLRRRGHERFVLRNQQRSLAYRTCRIQRRTGLDPRARNRNRRSHPRHRRGRQLRRLPDLSSLRLKDGSLYRMWYNGSTKPFNCPTGTLADNRRIGYAESTDGLHFTRFHDGPGRVEACFPRRHGPSTRSKSATSG